MLFFNRKPKIRVEFADVETGKVFVVSDVPVENLPDSFELETTFDLKGAKWVVTQAEPVTKDEFRRTGKLRLTVRKIEYMDPKKILYSLPTISNELTAFEEGSSSAHKDVLELHEDDWRQIEFLSPTLSETIEKNLAAIRQIFATQRTEIGAFRSLHIREGLAEPLKEIRLTKAELTNELGPSAKPQHGITLVGASELVRGGFAFCIGDKLYIYGIEEKGRVTELGICGKVGAIDPVALAALQVLVQRHRLRLVDWCRATLKSDDGIAELLT